MKSTILELLGTACVIVGVAALSLPLAVIILGTVLIGIGYSLGRTE